MGGKNVLHPLMYTAFMWGARLPSPYLVNVVQYMSMQHDLGVGVGLVQVNAFYSIMAYISRKTIWSPSSMQN